MQTEFLSVMVWTLKLSPKFSNQPVVPQDGCSYAKSRFSQCCKLFQDNYFCKGTTFILVAKFLQGKTISFVDYFIIIFMLFCPYFTITKGQAKAKVIIVNGNWCLCYGLWSSRKRISKHILSLRATVVFETVNHNWMVGQTYQNINRPPLAFIPW